MNFCMFTKFKLVSSNFGKSRNTCHLAFTKQAFNFNNVAIRLYCQEFWN